LISHLEGGTQVQGVREKGADKDIWKTLHNEDLFALYSSSTIVRVMTLRKMRWAGYVASMGDRKDAYRLLVGRPDGRTPLVRPRRRWQDNIKTYVQEEEWIDMERIDLAQDRDRWRAILNVVINFRGP
jgi:hypothetical protein